MSILIALLLAGATVAPAQTTVEIRPHNGALAAVKGGEVLDLTTNDFDLLWLLASNPGKIFTRDAILESLRGIDYDGIDRSVDIRVSRLRKKLGDDTGHPLRIKTIRGKGYLFVKEAWEE